MSDTIQFPSNIQKEIHSFLHEQKNICVRFYRHVAIENNSIGESIYKLFFHDVFNTDLFSDKIYLYYLGSYLYIKGNTKLAETIWKNLCDILLCYDEISLSIRESSLCKKVDYANGSVIGMILVSTCHNLSDHYMFIEKWENAILYLEKNPDKEYYRIGCFYKKLQNYKKMKENFILSYYHHYDLASILELTNYYNTIKIKKQKYIYYLLKAVKECHHKDSLTHLEFLCFGTNTYHSDMELDWTLVEKIEKHVSIKYPTMYVTI